MKTTIDAPRLSRYDGTSRVAKPDERLPVSDDWGVPAPAASVGFALGVIALAAVALCAGIAVVFA
jgi:hypothetical protein